MEPLLTYKNLTKDSTLLDLYNVTKIKFNIFTTKVNSMETVIFNHIDFPHYKIVDCLYMSSCIPGIFSPYYDISSNYTFVDGSLLVNVLIYILKQFKLENEELLCDNSSEEFDNINSYLENNMINYNMIYEYDVSCCYNIINDCSNYQFLDFDISLNKVIKLIKVMIYLN